MCGIFAGVGADISKETISTGLLATKVRGSDATGIFTLETGIIKSPVPADKFINSEKFSDVPSSTSLFIGHCRAATSGVPENNDNNHPMMGEKFVLVHNGIVHMKRLDGYDYKGECDTETLLSYLETKESIGEALRDVHGYATLVFSKVSDIEEGKRILYVWKSGMTASMSVAFKEGDGTTGQMLLLASTDTILKSVAVSSKLNGLVKTTSGWVYSEVDPYVLWRIEYKDGAVWADRIGEFRPSNNPLSREKTCRTVYSSSTGSWWNGKNGWYNTSRSSYTGRPFGDDDDDDDDFPCPQTGFHYLSPVCQSCSLVEMCRTEAQDDLYNYGDKNSEEIIKSKLCNGNFDSSDTECRVCVLRTFCAKRNLLPWDNPKSVVVAGANEKMQ